ncbi:cytosine permease [Cryobacterium sp. M91]|uniref:cytosine permease n=1 Tax=Cryobacterium sp. M91 TaxID=2048294 RepID=UPI000CE32286|nr:cytosine permease [Cryobacterium sp. M91]
METNTEAELFSSEYENEPVPRDKRRSLLSVASVWAGFPMIITGAVTGATLVNGLGFVQALGAMLIGNALLFGYVGTLSALGAKTGLNFSLQASRTFGRTGYMVCSVLLSTLVLGWFAVQTGLVGASMAGAFPVNATIIALIAGVLFTLFTLLGIRALSIIGMISVPLFLVLGIIAAVQASAHAASIWAYQGTQTGSLALGVGVTLVFALFADSGTMTADFTRWAKTPRQAWIATSTAFPVGNLIAMLVGGVIAAATAGSGDVFSLIAQNGGVLAVIAVVFLFVNLGSVCTHCLYNSAVGWSSVLNGKMRILTLILGAMGTVIAVLGIWGIFISWLILLGIIVPPIGAIIIADQFLTRRERTGIIPRVRWQPFVAWAIGSGLALAANLMVPEFSTVVIGLVFSAGSYLVITKLSQRAGAAAASVTN